MKKINVLIENVIDNELLINNNKINKITDPKFNISEWIDDYDTRVQYDDNTKYAIYNLNTSEKWIDKLLDGNVLTEFPEFLSNTYDYYISTPIGLAIFQNNRNMVIYDIFAHTSTIGFDFNNITPDYSMVETFNLFNNPLNFQTISFKKNAFLPLKQYKFNGQLFSQFNCDKIANSPPNENGYYINTPNVNNVQYKYRQLFFIKINIIENGNLITTPLSNFIGKLSFKVELTNYDNSILFSFNEDGLSYNDLIKVYVNDENHTIMIDSTNLNINGLGSLYYSIILEGNNTAGFMEVW